MTTNDVICRVCALYPYVSTDASSLSFDKGAVIDVLAQLDSGWWDGWCNGKRGWFPSNYVQVIEDDVDVPPIPRNDSSVSPPKRDSTWTDTQTFSRQYRNSTIDVHSHGDIEPHPNNETDRSNWILQTTEDGSEVYYYNVVTKEMRYSAPHEEFQRHDPLPTANSFGQKKYAYDEYDGVRPSKPTRAVNRIDNARAMDDVSYISGGTVASGSTCTPSILTSRSGIDDQLLPNWVRKFTPKGREYFCNIATDETVWSLDQVDPVTGVVYSRSPFPVSTEHKVPEEARLSLATMGGRGIDEAPRNWNQLSSLVAHAVRNLKDSVQQGHINVFRKEALVVVQQIRLLLYVSNAVDKENSPNLKASKQLRTHHRALLAALAKLVLSAKVASGAWPPPEAINKLQLDADEVLVAVRSFLSVAQEMQLEILDSAPKLLQSGNAPPRWRNTASIGAKPDAITTLLVLADNVHGAIASLMDSIRDVVSATDESTILSKVKSDIPLLVAQFRNLSNTTSQFLNSVDDFSTLKSSHAVRLSAAKQEICNAMGALFIETQKISSPNAIPKVIFTAFDDIESCAKIVESNAQEICLLSRQLAVQASPAQIPEGGAGRRPSQDAIRPALPNRASRSLETVEERLMDRNPIDSSGPVDQGAPKMENVSTHQPGDKLAKFFGEDTLAAARRRDTVLGAPAPAQGVAFASGTPGSSPSVNERTDFLGSDYNPNEIVFNMEGDVKGGTLTALVQRLTQHDQLDSKFITTFLLTYRSFCTTREMFDALFKRYSLAPPPDLTPEELQIWHEKKLKLVRLRVFNVIKQWLETYYNEEEDRAILPDLMTFADTTVRESMQFGAEQLIKIIRKRMDAEESSQIKKMTLNVRTSDMPAPLLPKNLKRIRFLDIDPLELARQLTIMDSKLYSRIKPVECLDKNWGKGDSELIAANVKASIEYSNQVTAWVTDSILSKDEVKKRAAVVKHWIYVAEKCRQLNNYNTCMAILSAFDNSSIGRLKRTWELMGARTMQILTGIRRLMGANKNFTEYRDIIHKVNPPCIPFLGIYLQDLTFIEDGNSNFLKKSNHLINFAKRMKTAEVIRELQQYQSTPYLLQAVPDIQEFIKTHLQSSRDEETLYNLSLALEPRERDEDTIARRLKESGL